MVRARRYRRRPIDFNLYPGRVAVQDWFDRLGVKRVQLRRFFTNARNSPHFKTCLRAAFKGFSKDPCVHTGKGRRFLAWIKKCVWKHSRDPQVEMANTPFSPLLTSTDVIKANEKSIAFFGAHYDDATAILDYCFGVTCIRVFNLTHPLRGFSSPLPIFPKRIRKSYLACQEHFLPEFRLNNPSYVKPPANWDDAYD